MKARIVLAVALASGALSGCVSTLTVRSVAAKPRARGFRYFLPKPNLLVSPKVDGTVSVEKVCLPDPANEYAIDASSFAATYKLSVEIDAHGLLKKVVWNTGSAESTKAAPETTANLWKARADAEAARAKTGDGKAGKGETKDTLDEADQALAQTGSGDSAIDRVQAKAWGPFLFEVVDTPDKVTLRPVNKQALMPTSKK